MSIDGLHFLAAGIERSDGTLLIPGYDTSVDMAADPHTLLLIGEPGAMEEVGYVPWQASAACADPNTDKLVIVGRWGNYIKFGSVDDYNKGVVDDDGEIEYRSVDRVGTDIYASGGGRTVPRLTDAGWVDESAELSGGNLIEAVSGFSADELYGFGWSGEIWLRESLAWRQIDSPTDRILQAAAVVDDEVYAGGQLGVIIQGRGAQWRVLENPYAGDIWSICEYDGVPYFSTINGVLRLVDGVIEQTDTSALKSTKLLFCGPSGLWSVGGGTLGLYDGTSWRCVDQT